MLKEKVVSVISALGEVQWRISDESIVELVRGCRRNLEAIAEQAGELEQRLVPETVKSEGRP